MAKTTNHPPYEIDPWKADTTEPPSGLTFNPEIVETAGKPKQEPVAPEPTEGQLKIEESISRVDRFDNEMRELKEQQEKVLKEVQSNIDDANEKIKQLNDLEEKIKKQVGEYTEDTDKYLHEAELLKGELEESKTKMNQAVTDASSAIAAAEKAQKALDAYKNGESQRIKDAITKAQEGVAKASEVNKQISDLKNSLGGEINKQISSNDTIAKIKADNQALSSKLDDALKTSKQGVDDAAKAIEAIENNVEIGASLITVMPGTTRPYWTKDLSVVKEGTKGEYFYSDSFEVGIDGPLVKINPKIEYRLYLDAFGYDGESKITISFVDKNGNNVSVRVSSYEEKNGKKVKVEKANYTQFPLYTEVLTPTWQNFDYVIEFLGEVEFVKLGQIRFNAYSKEKKKQCIRNFRIEPLIPTQADVDRAQNKAIEANSLALEQQKAINKANDDFKSLQGDFNSSQIKLNKTYDAMWDAQGKRNLLQEGIDTSQNQAVIANARASLTPALNNSLVPYASPSDEDILKGRAIWTTPHYSIQGNAGYVRTKEKPASGKPKEVSDIGWAIGTNSGQGTMGYHGPDTPCVPGATYNVEFWGYGSSAGSLIYIELRETGTGQHAVASGTGDTFGSSYIVSGLELKQGWNKYTGTITIKEGIHSVYINNWYWNHPRGTTVAGQLITGLKIDLAVPSVWDVLKNQEAINDKQSGIAAAHTKAIDSNRKAIRALAKIDLGGSLLAYMPLTDAEIEKGITREYIPAWAANASNVLDGKQNSGSDSAKGYVFLGSSGGSAKGEEVYAQVSPGTQYLFEIDITSPVNALINFGVKCSNTKIDRPIEKFMYLEKDDYGGYQVTKSTFNNRSVPISSSDTYQNGYRYLVEFKEGVEDVYVDYMKWTKSPSITVKSLSFAPYTPSQAAIDARQNKALEGLKLAQELQTQMTKKNAEFAKDIYNTSTGIFHLSRDQAAGSIQHRAGFVMPSYETTFRIYARTDFSGNFIVLVNYATGLGDGLRSYMIQESQLTLAKYPNDNVSSDIVKRSIFQGQDYYKYYNLEIPNGDVESIIVFIDHIDWKRP